MVLSDQQIIEGLKRRDESVTREYFYTYCRIAYYVYNRKYSLQTKPGMDFFSLAHEYYLKLALHDFKQLEDHAPHVALKTWMVNGFRFVLLDKLKEVQKEQMRSLEERVDSGKIDFEVPDHDYKAEVRILLDEICTGFLGRDSKNSIILKSIILDGMKGKDVATELGMTPSAVSQRYTRLMQHVVTPYFRGYYEGPEVSYSMSCHYDYDVSIHECKHPTSVSKLFQSFSKSSIPTTMDYTKRITPDMVTSLREHEIFVFGSNLQGLHGGGAARLAYQHFGAVMGQGVGLQGQSYGIPTMQGGVDTIRPYVDEFIAFARAHADLTFLVTRIGCGIAGFTVEEIAPLFEDAKDVENICLPADFWPHVL